VWIAIQKALTALINWHVRPKIEMSKHRLRNIPYIQQIKTWQKQPAKGSSSTQKQNGQ
jgi:hypothetical protein